MMSCERPVSNGMMMVNYQPKEQSQAFAPGISVATVGPAQVFLGPGTNYGVMETIPGGTSGTVVDDTNGLNGVKAKGTYWWKVTLPGVTGWVAEENLVTQ
jgi:hypothetical protein